MIPRLAELNRVLIVARELRDDDGRASVNAVVRQCGSTAIEGQLPDHGETIAFAEKIGLVTRHSGMLQLTETAGVFLSFNPEQAYDLTVEQRRLLLRTVYLSGMLKDDVRGLLKSFAPAFNRETYRWSALDGPSLGADGEIILGHLRQLNAVVHSGDIFEVSAAYVDSIAALLAEGSGWDHEALKRFLAQRTEVGEIAEELVLRWERGRLRAAACDVEAECVRSISRLKVAAGYDIESFDAASAGLNYDRFIEVKGSRGSDVNFMWSESEMGVARRLGSQYWLYFQGGIDVSRRVARNEVLLFQDPINSILGDSTFIVKQHVVSVQKAVRGKRVTT